MFIYNVIIVLFSSKTNKYHIFILCFLCVNSVMSNIMSLKNMNTNILYITF